MAAEPLPRFLWETELVLHWILDDQEYRSRKQIAAGGAKFISLSSLTCVLCIISSIPTLQPRWEEYADRIAKDFTVVDMRIDDMQHLNPLLTKAVDEQVILGGDELVNAALCRGYGFIVFTKDVAKFTALIGLDDALG